jgi:hypothetical protein
MDGGTVQLALRLAMDIDRTDIADKDAAAFQGKLLDVLKELGMTPRARRLSGADEPAQASDPLAEIAAIRRERLHGHAGA